MSAGRYIVVVVCDGGDGGPRVSTIQCYTKTAAREVLVSLNSCNGVREVFMVYDGDDQP